MKRDFCFQKYYRAPVPPLPSLEQKQKHEEAMAVYGAICTAVQSLTRAIRIAHDHGSIGIAPLLVKGAEPITVAMDLARRAMADATPKE